MLGNTGPLLLTCPCCLLRGLRLRPDRKQRLFYQCSACGTIIFSRNGHLGIWNIAKSCEALGSEPTLKWVREQSIMQAERGDMSVMELLRPAAEDPSVVRMPAPVVTMPAERKAS